MTPTATAPRRTAAPHARSAPRRAAGPRPQRRVSGPLGGRLRPQVAPRESVALGERALALVRGLPDHSLIDRLVRGRAWIPVLGVLLAGIVAMQVEILKLGTNMGREMERSSALQTRNEALQASVATLADDQRIERLAVGMGMVMPRPDSFVFLSAKSGDIGRAIADIRAPDPVGFTSQLAAEAAAAAALLPPAPPTVSSSTGTGTTTGTSAAATPSTVASAAAPTGSAGVAAPATTTQPAPVAPSPTSSSSTSTSSSSTSTSGGGATTSGAAALAPATSSQSGAGSGG